MWSKERAQQNVTKLDPPRGLALTTHHCQTHPHPPPRPPPEARSESAAEMTAQHSVGFIMVAGDLGFVSLCE